MSSRRASGFGSRSPPNKSPRCGCPQGSPKRHCSSGACGCGRLSGLALLSPTVVPDAPLWTAACIATGNTLEAVTAAWVLSHVIDFDPAFQRSRDGVAFVLVAGLLTPVISATTGVTALCAAGVQPWARFAELWSAWTLGDALGALVVAPAILTTLRRGRATYRREWIEGAVLIAATVTVSHLVFGNGLGSISRQHPLEYLIVPFLIGAAVRQGQPTTALVVISTSVVAIWHTLRGSGPFADVNTQEALLFLQAFTGMLAATGLLLAAAIDERKMGERRRAAAAGIGNVLAGAADLSEAAPGILRVVCEKLRWPVGALWVADDSGSTLRCLALWTDDERASGAFTEATASTLFPPGIGLPGRVWASGTPAWIENVGADDNFPRAAAARAAGLHAAFAFPVRVGDKVGGVIEFFNRTVVRLDSDLLSTMSAVGNHIGQFIVRTRIEAAVAREHRRMHAILDTALDAVIGMDHDGRITDFNPAAERIFGYSRAAAVGQELANLLIPEHLRASHRHGLQHYLATGQGPLIDKRVETTAWHADGHEFPAEVAITRVVDTDPPLFTGYVRDLTTRFQAEQERDQLLQRALDARREAEAANRAKDEFLATLSHELRTPLNAIAGWTRMLLAGTMDPASATRALQVIDRNAQLQVQLVSDILDVSRIVTGGLKLELQPVDLGSVIGAALDVVRPAAEAKQILLSARLASPAQVVEADPQRVQQIIWNLLANAVKFTPPRGRVNVSLDEGPNQTVTIRVEDNGPGIAADFLPYVFERFRQADSSSSREHGGLGLGLAIVRHLTELHGGTVRAESEGPGEGATFIVTLPRIDRTPTVAEAGGHGMPVETDTPTAGRAPSLAGIRVLIVDDDEDARELITAILRGAGAEVQIASSAREALRHLDASQPDVLLSDIVMPGTDGFDLIRDVRRLDDARRRHLPAAAITAYPGDTARKQALKAGYDRCVSKPLQAKAVIQTVLSLVRSDRPS